jgi:hypothetical protein
MDTIEANPADKGTSQTPANNEEIKEETYTKAQHTEAILRETAKVKAAEVKKREKLEAELAEMKKATLPDPEKVKLEIAERDKKISEAEAKLASYEAREKKRAALDAAKLTLPADITIQDLLDMMPGNDDDAIAGYVQKFKKMFPESRGLGTQTTQGTTQGTVSLSDQIRAMETKMLLLETPMLEKEKLAREVIKLKGRLAKGET